MTTTDGASSCTLLLGLLASCACSEPPLQACSSRSPNPNLHTGGWVEAIAPCYSPVATHACIKVPHRRSSGRIDPVGEGLNSGKGGLDLPPREADMAMDATGRNTKLKKGMKVKMRVNKRKGKGDFANGCQL